MAEINYSKLNALIIDDFSSFRATLAGMLDKIGIKNLKEAVKVSEALKLCKDQPFDLILCDYNLGKGRNGQHLLEELRGKRLISRKTLFLMVTAESGRDMFLSAFDCKPDDYLVKPLNLQVLSQRLKRLMGQRVKFGDAYTALDNDDFDTAIPILESVANTESREAVIAQKLLGEAYLRNQDFDKAKVLFERVLAQRTLDWAEAGLARVMAATGAKDEAIQKLEDLTVNSRMYLPAYDTLGELYEEIDDPESVQMTLEKAIDVSPYSIIRQRKLSHVAESNGDVMKALKSSLAASKMGEFSVHSDVEDTLTFVKAAAAAIDSCICEDAVQIAEESHNLLNKAKQKNSLSIEQSSLANLLHARVLLLTGHNAEAQALFREEEKFLDSRRNIEMDLAKYDFLISAGNYPKADAFVIALQDYYRDDPVNSDKIDRLLPEPQSEANRARVGKLNRKGIELYNNGRYDDAIECFQKAINIFPRHAGLQLNRLQSLVGKLKAKPGDHAAERLTEHALQVLHKMFPDESHPQAKRLHKLEALANQIKSKN